MEQKPKRREKKSLIKYLQKFIQYNNMTTYFSFFFFFHRISQYIWPYDMICDVKNMMTTVKFVFYNSHFAIRMVICHSSIEIIMLMDVSNCKHRYKQ